MLFKKEKQNEYCFMQFSTGHFSFYQIHTNPPKYFFIVGFFFHYNYFKFKDLNIYDQID